MPPQPGIFALPYGATHSQGGGIASSSSQGGGSTGGKASRAGLTCFPNSQQQDSNIVGVGRHFTESISALHHTAHVLATRPEMNSLFKLRLFPLSLERSAQLAQFEAEERYAIECAQIAYDEERERVEEEWKKGRQRVRERLLEGIEERRRRAREEKEGEGTVGDPSLDSHSRPPITRKLRNKLGTSPPPTPHNTNTISGSTFTSNNLTGMSTTHHLPFTIGPFSFLNPHSLSVDELPSPFPLPLTSTNVTNGGSGATSGGATGNGNGPSNGGRRRAKGGGGNQGQALGGLGKSLLLLNMTKDTDIENDLGEIRRGNKRRRAAVAPGASKTS